MSSSHLLRVLRPTCNFRQIYLSRTLPLYTGVFHHRFFSAKPRGRGRPKKLTEEELNASKLNLPPIDEEHKRSETVKPRGRGRSKKITEEESNASKLNLPPIDEAPVKKRRKRSDAGKPRGKIRPKRLTEEELNAAKLNSPPAKPRATRRKSELTDEELNVSKLKLPPIDKWRQYFAIMEGQRLRFFLRNPDTARILAEAFIPEGSKDLIVVEAAAGPGQLTRALLNLPRERIKKLIVLEKPEKLLDFLKPLEEVDSRFHVFPYSPKEWNSYTKLFETGLLDELQTVEWKEVHPQLRFILHINSTVEGEQLLAQLLRAIPDRQWLFKYGRVPMDLVLSSRMWDRIRAPARSTTRCKVSVMAQVAAKMSTAVPYDTLQPFQDHFHPTVPKYDEGPKGSSLLDERRTGSPMSAISVIPLKEQLIVPGDLDYWDYCLRKLFVQKATALNKCISLLGPGAKNLLPLLNDKNLPAEEWVDTKKNPRELELREWALVVGAFKRWPFKPEDLSIDNFFVSGSRF